MQPLARCGFAPASVSAMADHDPGLQLDDELVARAHGHMARGIYDSLDHVVIAAFEALDREAEAFDAMVCEKIAVRWPIPNRLYLGDARTPPP